MGFTPFIGPTTQVRLTAASAVKSVPAVAFVSTATVGTIALFFPASTVSAYRALAFGSVRERAASVPVTAAMNPCVSLRAKMSVVSVPSASATASATTASKAAKGCPAWDAAKAWSSAVESVLTVVKENARRALNVVNKVNAQSYVPNVEKRVESAAAIV